MTLPYERTCAVIEGRRLFVAMLDPKATPRVPKYLREWARQVLKHYPHEFDMERPDKAFGPLSNPWP